MHCAFGCVSAWVGVRMGACAHVYLGAVHCVLGSSPHGCVCAWVGVRMGAWMLCTVCLGAYACVFMCASVYACVLL